MYTLKPILLSLLFCHFALCADQSLLTLTGHTALVNSIDYYYVIRLIWETINNIKTS
jgi:hypothetical protein